MGLHKMIAGAGFEMALLCLLLLTAGALVWKDALLERTIHFTPATTAAMSHMVFSDGDTDGKSIVKERAPLRWDCDLRPGNPYPYCGYELFLDKNRGVHGLDLANMRSFAITMMYRGASTSFRVHLKNFDPRYSDKADDESPKYLRVEADTTPGKLERTEFVLSDFGVADWWLRKRKLPPDFGRPQFDNITSLIIETGSEAPLGPHQFDVRDITVRRAILSDAQWYSLLLGLWIVMIVLYLGYRLGNLRRALKERQMLEAIALREAQEAACRDPLTGLLNRRGLAERFDALIKERRQATAMAVILIDIDHFKVLNDTYGHDRGDQALAAFAQVVGRNIRAGDLAARWGRRGVHRRLRRCRPAGGATHRRETQGLRRSLRFRPGRSRHRQFRHSCGAGNGSRSGPAGHGGRQGALRRQGGRPKLLPAVSRSHGQGGLKALKKRPAKAAFGVRLSKVSAVAEQFLDAIFQGHSQDLAHRVVLFLDLVANDGADGVEVGVHQHARRRGAFGFVVHHLAQRTGDARDQRIAVGGPKPFQVVGAIEQRLGVLDRQALGLDRGLDVFELLDFVHQPAFELARQIGQGSFGLVDGFLVKRPQPAADLGAQRVGYLDDLGFFRKGHTLVLNWAYRFVKASRSLLMKR